MRHLRFLDCKMKEGKIEMSTKRDAKFILTLN